MLSQILLVHPIGSWVLAVEWLQRISQSPSCLDWSDKLAPSHVDRQLRVSLAFLSGSGPTALQLGHEIL